MLPFSTPSCPQATDASGREDEWGYRPHSEGAATAGSANQHLHPTLPPTTSTLFLPFTHGQPGCPPRWM